MENIRGNIPEDMPDTELKNHVALVAIASKSAEKIQEMLENSTRVDMLEGVVENSNDQIQQIQEEINQMKRSLRDLLSEEVITIQLDLGDEVEVDPGDVEVEVMGAEEEGEEAEDMAPDEDEVEAAVEADEEEGDEEELDLSELVNELEEMDHGASEGHYMEEEEDADEGMDHMMEALDDDVVLEIDEDMLREELSKLMQESEDAEEEIIEEASEEEEEVLEETAEPVATEQNDELQAELESYQSAVADLKSQLAEMSLFNAKLLYTNKLLMNSDLSQTQRAQAIETLDDAASLREVKLLFKTLTESFSKRAEDKSTSRTIGGSSRPTKSASMNLNESKETNRWALLAGINN